MVSTKPPGIEDEFYASGCHVHDVFKRYFLEDKSVGGHYQIHLHSNGLCYVTLAPTHPIIKDNLVIKSVEFPVQRLSNQVSGKRKRGCQALQSSSILCTVNTACEKKFTVRASVDGKLAEINKRLLTTPEEIKSRNKGFVAIFMTKWVDFKSPLPRDWIEEKEFLQSHKDELL